MFFKQRLHAEEVPAFSLISVAPRRMFWRAALAVGGFWVFVFFCNFVFLLKFLEKMVILCFLKMLEVCFYFFGKKNGKVW